MKFFLLILGFVTKHRNYKNENRLYNMNELYDTNEIQSYPMNIFKENIPYLKFKPQHLVESGYDARFDMKENNDIALACIRRLYYLNNLLQHLESNKNENEKLELVEEFDKYSNTTPFVPDISAGGLFDDWDNDFVL